MIKDMEQSSYKERLNKLGLQPAKQAAGDRCSRVAQHCEGYEEID